MATHNLRELVAVFAAILALAAMAPAPVQAQWLKYKTPGIPRLPNGKPNLSAPAPRTADGKPDLSGLWRGDDTTVAATSKAMDAVQPLPWAKTLWQQRKDDYGRDSPRIRCLPSGVQIDSDVGKVIQTPNLLVMMFDGTLYRQIYLDGRPLPKDPNPDWMGYSVGHWEGDTLVIVTAGFNDRTWLDNDGIPHTEALRITERIRRPDFGHLEVIRTAVDPGALAKPWTVPVKFELNADTDELEYVCNENEKDAPHLIGKVSDDKGVTVAPQILAKYAGLYDFTDPVTHKILTLTFSLSTDHLVLTGIGPESSLIAASDAEFSTAGLTLKFVKNAAGAVSEVDIQAVEGNFKAIRK